MSQGLDLKFRKGDPVAKISYPYNRRYGTISEIKGSKILIYNWIEKKEVWLPENEVGFSCHNHDAPFTKYVFDGEESFEDGYNSGFEWAVLGHKYQAGGPGHPHDVSSQDCRHYREYADLQKKANEIWRKGWSKGQSYKRYDLNPEQLAWREYAKAHPEVISRRIFWDAFTFEQREEALNLLSKPVSLVDSIMKVMY